MSATRAMSAAKASTKKRALNSEKKVRVEEDDLFDPDLSRFVFLSFFVSFSLFFLCFVFYCESLG